MIVSKLGEDFTSSFLFRSAMTLNPRGRLAWRSQRPGEEDNMAKPFASQFYKSRAWKNCKDGYIKSVGGLCERCLKRGIYSPGRIVHHKTYIGPENIDNPDITMNWDNLELLCRSCHELEHKGHGRRYQVMADGSVVSLDRPLS